MGLLEETLKGKSLADYTNTQLKLALGAVLYTNTADMWKQYLNQLGYSGDVSQMLQKYYVDYNIPDVFRNYVNAGAGIFSPQQFFEDGSVGVLYDNNDFVDSATWRRNLLTWTQEFDNAAWIKTNLATTPQGGGVFKLVPDTASGTHRVHQVVTPLSRQVITVEVKAAELTKIGIGESAQTGNFVSFDAATGQALVNSTKVKAVALEDGWWRVSFKVFDGDLVASSFFAIVALPNTATAFDNPATFNWSGDGTSGILIRYPQVNPSDIPSANFSTSAYVAPAYQRITDFNSDFLAAFPNTTLFADSYGTTPAVVNGPVGLQLDKSQGLVLSEEKAVNGGFDTDTVWLKDAGVTIADGKCSFASVASGANIRQTGAVVGKWYRVQYDVVSCSSGGFRPVRALLAPVASTPGTYVAYFLCGSVNDFAIRAMGVTTGEIDNVSFKELPGNHRYQDTATSRPTLRGTPTGSELFTAYGTPGAGWSVAGATGTATTASSALPTTTASVVGKFYRVTYTVTRSAGSVQLSFGGRTGVSRSAAGQYVEYFDNTTSTNVLTATGTSFTGTVRIDEVKDVSAGSVTAPYGLQYDGVDDFMQTASVNFSATDKMFVCAGVRKLSDAAYGCIAELSANKNINAGSFSLFGPDTSLSPGDFGFCSRGTVNADSARATAIAPTTNIVTGIGNIPVDSTILRFNGVQVASSAADQGTGNYGNYPLYFGRRGGTSLPFNGLEFGLVIVGKTLTASQIASVERWMAYRTGVTL